MPFTFTAEYSTDGTTWTALTNVQNVSGFAGRQKLVDTFEPSRMTVTLRYPTGYASPITALVVGTQIRINRTGATYEIWRGRIRNVSASYGIPYVGGVGNADFLTIECEGALAEFGRLQGNEQVIDTDLVTYQLSDVSTYTGITFGTTFTVANSPTLATSTVSGSYAEWFNTLANSVGATIKDGSGQIGVYTKDFVGTLPVAFSDVANNATNQVYDALEFESLSADYFTGVEVITNTVGTVEATNAPAGQAPRTYRINTFNVSTGQALDVALYWLGIFDEPNFGITSVSCLAEAQNSMDLELGYGWWDLPGYRTYVTFRGTSYYMTILGVSIDATPASTRYTYYVADTTLTPYLVLDDPIYGLLDENLLSW
jgi:hypothetical protein